MPIELPNDLTACRSFFLEPTHPRHRLYEALRAYFVEGRPSHEVASDFGYTPGSFRVFCHQFRRDRDPAVLCEPTPRTADAAEEDRRA